MKKTLGFTLAEVLITLVIIGVVAAITVPTMLLSTQQKEFHSALRKNISVIKNAFNLAQVNEGIMGDNSAIVYSTDIKNATDVASGWGICLGLSKYINANNICIKSASKPIRKCEDNEIEMIKTRWTTKQNQQCFMWLQDGTIYAIRGILGYHIILNTGEPQENESAYIYIDVNGDKGPNKWGQDLYVIKVTEKDIEVFDNEELEPSEKMKKILLNAI